MINSASKISFFRLEQRRSREVRPEALVAFVRDTNERDAAFFSTAPLRDQVAPLAEWIEIDLGPVSPARRHHWLAGKLSKALRDRQMHSLQLVILSWHNAARIALDLTLKGMISCSGIVAVDLLCVVPRDPISVTSASIRIVLHDSQNDPAQTELIDALRRQDADFRLMTLPFDAPEARDITTRATAAFLAELTAKACRQSA
jgi:hypothetical protein